METVAQTAPAAGRPRPVLDPAAAARRRWARAALIYVLLLAFSLLFVGPFLFAILSSLKDNPAEWPPRLDPPQLNPANWRAAWRLGKAGGGSGLFGQFAPGAVVNFDVTYFVPEGRTPHPPEVTISRRVPGAGIGAVVPDAFAADYAIVSEVVETARKPAEGGVLVTYSFTIRHDGQGPAVDRLPLDLLVPIGQTFHSATLAPNRIERLGRVQSWNNITPGLVPYVFHNYNRVFNENYSRTTGKNLFLAWIRNSLFIAGVKVLTTVIIASMSGYALARLRFPGRNALFIFILFSMMIPGQVTFISNYLVLRDGVFGISRLFGVDTLLNTFTGLIVSGLCGGSAVFIMKQFFETLPRELEESARIDGAGPLMTYSRIVLPLARPALGAVAILTFQGAWNEFFWPLVALTAPQDKLLLTVGLLNLRRAYGAVALDWGPLLAAAIISALPIIIIFLIFQRYFVEGISFSGIKG
ncbi:MAG: carbohydrate ABC transporter permease [Firmicutes bacterium]|nr:carbohydrate ABC transporter permease [Bacillota bacterium]